MESVPFGTVGAIASGAGYRASHQAAVVAPVEAEPRPSPAGLILQVSGRVEILVVVDAEHFASNRTWRRFR